MSHPLSAPLAVTSSADGFVSRRPMLDGGLKQIQPLSSRVKRAGMAAPRPAELLIGGAKLYDVADVNGEFTRVQDARVSILDREFLFGDGVYEVAAVLEGKLIDYDAHLS